MHSVSFLFSFSVFCPNFGITSLALNTVSHFVSVFEYGCENEGLNHTRVLIHLLRKIVWFRDYWRREISCKARFYYPNKKVETYEVLTERDIEIFLVRVCERVWTTELNIKKGTRVEMLDLGTRSRKAGTVTVPLLLPKQWLRLVHRFHFHSNKFHLYVSQKEKKLLTRFEEVAGTLTPR